MPQPSKTAESKGSHAKRTQSEHAHSKRTGADEREQRLAAALRENLKRRKAQQRGRGEAGDAPAARTGTPGGGGGRD